MTRGLSYQETAGSAPFEGIVIPSKRDRGDHSHTKFDDQTRFEACQQEYIYSQVRPLLSSLVLSIEGRRVACVHATADADGRQWSRHAPG